MKILHFADLHIGMENYGKLDPETGLNSRLGDFLNSLDFIIDYAIEKKIKIILFAGDVFRTRDPSPTEQRAFAQRIKKLSEHEIYTIILIGNHDMPNNNSKANSVDIYDVLDLPFVKVSSKMEKIKIETEEGNVNILTVPWIAKTKLLEKEEYKKLSVEELNETILKKFISVFEDQVTSLKKNEKNIVMAHASVAGATIGAEKNIMLGADIVLPLSIFNNPIFNYVALGHIHKYQLLNAEPPVIYSGSIERVDFGEEKDDKGFLVVDLEKKNNYKFIKTPAREFLTIKVVLSTNEFAATNKIISEIEKYDLKQKIVRVLIELPENIQESVNWNDVRKVLNKASFVGNISKKIIYSERDKHLDYQIKEEHDPKEALNKYLGAKGISNERAKKIMDAYCTLADEI